MNNLALIVTILVTVAVIDGEDLMDQVFGEALLKSLSPTLRDKLQEIHNTGVFKSKSESETARIVKSLLTTEEIKELEAAYKRLILPMLQNTLEQRMGRKYKNLDDIPIEFEDDEIEDVEVDDFKTESEEQTERKIRENKSKEKKVKKVDSLRTVNIEENVKQADRKNSGTVGKDAKVDTSGLEKETDKRRAKEEL
uniref:Stress response protein NST1 n=1 Tax=Lygus hesperus TaxID=30085 RepID=A0A0A9Y4V2_LYGHE